MKLLITYMCINLADGRRNVPFQYLVDNEAEAAKRFVEDAGRNFEINEIFIDVLTDEEAEEWMKGGE